MSALRTLVLMPVLGGLMALRPAVADGAAPHRPRLGDSGSAFAHDTGGVDAKTVQQGRAVYHGAGNCATCHGQQLEGGIGPTLRAHAWKDAKGGSLAAINGVLLHGVSGTAMTSHPGGISAAQATQVATYVWAVSHGKAKP